MPLLMPTWQCSLLLWFALLFFALAAQTKAVFLPQQVALQWARLTLTLF